MRGLQVTFEQEVLLLTRIVRLIEEMTQTQADYIGKDITVQYLRWTTEHIAKHIWQRSVTEDYDDADA